MPPSRPNIVGCIGIAAVAARNIDCGVAAAGCLQDNRPTRSAAATCIIVDVVTVSTTGINNAGAGNLPGADDHNTAARSACRAHASGLVATGSVVGVSGGVKCAVICPPRAAAAAEENPVECK